MKYESSFLIAGSRVEDGTPALHGQPGPGIADAPARGAHSVVSCIVNGAAVPVAGAGVTAVAVTSAGGRLGRLLVDAGGGLEFLPLDGFGDLPEGGSDSIRVSCTLSDGNGDLSTVSANIRLTGHPGALMVRGVVEGQSGADARETILVLIDDGPGDAAGGTGGNLFVDSRVDTALASLTGIASEIATVQGRPDQEITVIPVGGSHGAATTLAASEIAAPDFAALQRALREADDGDAQDREGAPEAEPEEPEEPACSGDPDAEAASALDTLLARAAVNNSRTERGDTIFLDSAYAGAGLIPDPDTFDFGTGI